MGEPQAPEESTPARRERRAVLLRLAPELHEALRAWAAAELRSLNAHVEFLLREAVRRRRGERERPPDES